MSLIEAFKLIRELLILGVKVMALYREAKRKAWIQEGELIGDALKKAQNDDDRARLARRLFDHRMLDD